MPAVQFIGRSAVVDAFKNRGLEVWGLFQSRQFITAGEGAEALNDFLLKLEPGGSMAVYTLQVYKNADPEEITNKTENNGAVNFKLTDPNLAGTGGDVNNRLARLEGIIAGSEDDDDDDNGEDSLTGIIMGWLKEPDKLATAIGAFQALVKGTGAGSIAPMPGAVGTIEDRRETPSYAIGGQQSDEVRTHRLAMALDQLEKKDPKILDHLEKLASLATNKPDLFKFLITQLDAL